MKIVIRAGGVGTRLWPMSRKHNPKQFQAVVGAKSMLATTHERVRPLFRDPANIFVSTHENFLANVRAEVPELAAENIIIETDTRNTGPAMCLEVCFLEERSEADEIIASLPSDDYISDSEAFRDLLVATEKFLKDNPEMVLTPAVRAEYPDIGYTYFKAGASLAAAGEEAILEVAQVVEKPNKEYCQELLDRGVYYCHTGMYVWRLKTIVGLFEKFEPSLLAACRAVVEAMKRNDWERAREIYARLEKNTVETIVTNKVEKLAMSVSNRIGWSDLGKWHIIKKMIEKETDGNVTKGEVLAHKATNNLIYSNNEKKIIVVNDVHNLAIVDTGDALFVSSLEDSAEVKKIVEKLKEAGKEHYL